SQAAGDAHRVPLLAGYAEELLHNVEERACRDREERDTDRLARPGLSEHGAEEGRRAADQPEYREEGPSRACPLAADRAADAEALGRVVEREAASRGDGGAGGRTRRPAR